MKLIISRKGFDSSAGGVPSPIFPNGEMLSLPIPDHGSAIRYRDITWNGKSMGPLVEQLTVKAIRQSHGVHLDPDIRADALTNRPLGWRGLFGQAGAAQSHLSTRVGKGDLFLFFGWFRQVSYNPDTGRYGYLKKAPNLHVLFGWLQIENTIGLESGRPDLAKWMSYHPHCLPHYPAINNTLYIAREDLTLGNKRVPGKGYGSIRHYDDRLCLSCKDQPKRSVWKLPMWFYPYHRSRSALSYHDDMSRWNICQDGVLLNTAARGQEFILDTDEYPEAVAWVQELLDVT